MQKSKWLTYLFRGLFILVFGALMLGIIYEQAARFRAQYKYRAPGAFAALEDYDVHYLRAGDGGPTIVFESGLGGDHTIWKAVQEPLAQQTTTLSYDRSGLLWSESSRKIKDAEAISKELYALLEAIKAPKPYIVVGHSLAGCSLRPFIRDHSSDIAGLVFVDVSHPEQNVRGSAALQAKMNGTLPNIAAFRFAAGFGPLRMVMNKNPYNTNLPNDDPENVAYRQNRYRSIDGIIAEMKGVEKTLEQAKTITSFGNIPLTVITAKKRTYPELENAPDLAKEMQDLWSQLQKELLSLSSNSKQIMATESSHMVPFDQPDLIVKAIQQQLGALEAQ